MAEEGKKLSLEEMFASSENIFEEDMKEDKGMYDGYPTTGQLNTLFQEPEAVEVEDYEEVEFEPAHDNPEGDTRSAVEIIKEDYQKPKKKGFFGLFGKKDKKEELLREIESAEHALPPKEEPQFPKVETITVEDMMAAKPPVVKPKKKAEPIEYETKFESYESAPAKSSQPAAPAKHESREVKPIKKDIIKANRPNIPVSTTPKEEAEHVDLTRTMQVPLPSVSPKKEEKYDYSAPKSISAIEARRPEPVIEEPEEYDATSILEPVKTIKPTSFKSLGFILKNLETEEEYDIKKPYILVGCKEQDCDLVVPQDKKHHNVSRRHAYLIVKNGKLYVKDESTNGTYIGYLDTIDSDFYRIPKDTEMELKNKQVVRFADIKYLVMYAN